jgi:drug/metabolite transporter (DMT)-like permease
MSLSVGAAAAIGAAMCFALGNISVRQLSRTDSSVAITIYFTGGCAIASVIPLVFDFRVPTVIDGAIMAAIGVVGGLGQLFLVLAHRAAPAAMVAPFNYFGIIWAALFGLVFWKEVPGAAIFAGAVLIFISGFVILKSDA